MGVNVVEREGISVWHPSRFILVGTMNPEEGELRPQLLDRFGLCVDVRGLRDLADRVTVLERDQRVQRGEGWEESADAERRQRDTIVRAEELLPLVDVPPAMRQFISLICLDAGALGHRADIVVSRTARTLCASREAVAVVAHAIGDTERQRPADALQVTPQDVIRAAELALAHRRREATSPSEQSGEGIADSARERLRQMESEAQTTSAEASSEQVEASPAGSGGDRGEGSATQSPERTEAQEPAPGQTETLFSGDTFQVRRLQLPRDRRTRRTAGKRNLTRSGDKRGRYVRSTQVERTTDLAFDATLRAAAPYQHSRRIEEAVDLDDPALLLERHDLRQKVRQRKTGTLIVFVVDASASMDAEQRMQATKGAVLSLLRDAYVRRDKVALVVFSGRTARVVLRPTSSVDLAEDRLQRLTVGGTTPLTHGLVAGLKIIRTERLRDPTVYPLMVLISDGRGNISLFGEEPIVEAQRVAAQIKTEQVRSLVIDSARDYTQHSQLPRIGGRGAQPLFGGYAFNACLDLAGRLGGRYFGLYDLSQGAILQSVQQELRAG
jgi:magnesium chelatase subunit D